MMETTNGVVAVDLFCGVGGLTYGLEKVGIDVRLGIDIEPACEHPIGENTSARFLQADVAAVDPSVIAAVFRQGKVSLLAGCAPCQPFSTYSRAAKGNCGTGLRGSDQDDWKL